MNTYSSHTIAALCSLVSNNQNALWCSKIIAIGYLCYTLWYRCYISSVWKFTLLYYRLPEVIFKYKDIAQGHTIQASTSKSSSSGGALESFCFWHLSFSIWQVGEKDQCLSLLLESHWLASPSFTWPLPSVGRGGGLWRTGIMWLQLFFITSSSIEDCGTPILPPAGNSRTESNVRHARSDMRTNILHDSGANQKRRKLLLTWREINNIRPRPKHGDNVKCRIEGELWPHRCVLLSSLLNHDI